MFKITSERLFWLLFPRRSSLWAKLKHFLSGALCDTLGSLAFWVFVGVMRLRLPAPASVSDNIYNGSQRKREIPLPYTGVNNVEAGGEACHGGRSGPPRLWPAVPLSCLSSQRTKPAQGGRGTWREKVGGGGSWSTAVTLLHIIWESGGKEGFKGHRERDRQRQRHRERELWFDALELDIPPSDFMLLCHKLTEN